MSTILQAPSAPDQEQTFTGVPASTPVGDGASAIAHAFAWGAETSADVGSPVAEPEPLLVDPGGLPEPAPFVHPLDREPRGLVVERALTAALEYAEAGFAVLPLRHGTKEYVKGLGPGEGTMDPDAIRRRFGRVRRNVAILTGGGLIALDVDPRNGGLEGLRDLLKGEAFPDTARTMTPGEGDHYWFSVPSGLEARSRTLRPGVELKAERACLPVEPSVDGEGQPYLWATNWRHLAPAPDWLLRAADPARDPGKLPVIPHGGPPRSGDYGALLADVVSRYPVESTGTRNDVMCQVLGSLLARGYDENLAASVTVDWWITYHRQGTVGTDPALAPRLVGASIRSMLRSRKFTPGVRVDHRALCRGIILTAEQERAVRDVVYYPGRPRTRESMLRQEEAYLSSWVVRATHALTDKLDEPLAVTYNQIQETMLDNFRVKVLDAQLTILASRYLTRPGRPAELFELAVRVEGGTRPRQGKATPSRYVPAGLRYLLDPTALTPDA
jgi:hypothetical protein